MDGDFSMGNKWSLELECRESVLFQKICHTGRFLCVEPLSFWELVARSCGQHPENFDFDAVTIPFVFQGCQQRS